MYIVVLCTMFEKYRVQVWRLDCSSNLEQAWRRIAQGISFKSGHMSILIGFITAIAGDCLQF